MFFLLVTVFTFFDRVLFFTPCSMYFFLEKEWLITGPSRYGAVVFENNHFSASDLNVGWTARDRGLEAAKPGRTKRLQVGNLHILHLSLVADGGHVIGLQSEFTL